jgi:alkaline phosphatase
MLRRVCALIVLSLLSFFALKAENAKNVILFIADAGGIPTLNAARIYGGRTDRLFIQRMPHIALMETASASDWVPDSASAATALVTGYRTNDRVLSQSDEAAPMKRDGKPLKTILEYAEERGLATGFVTNDAFFGATVAACYAHVNDRDMTAQIIGQLLDPRFGDGVDVILGAGRGKGIQAAKSMEIDLVEALRQAGYAVSDSVEALTDGNRRFAVLLNSSRFDVGLAVDRALKALGAHPKGFFLIVESDVHTNHLKRGLDRMLELDRVIERVAGQVPPQTLIIFAADHSYDLRVQRGRRGVPLLDASGRPSRVRTKHGLRPTVRVDDTHTAEEVLVAAQGPGAERVKGFISSTDLFHVMMAAFGWEERRLTN